MNSQDEKIRSTWIVMLWLIPIFQILLNYFFRSTFLQAPPHDLPAQFLNYAANVSGTISSSWMWNLIIACIMNHCSYKKMGTGWLSFTIFCFYVWLVLILLLIPTLIDNIKMVVYCQKFDTPSLNWIGNIFKFAIFIFITNIIINISWFYYCFKLRLVNIRHQLSLLMQEERFNKIFSMFEQTFDLLELKELFEDKVRENPTIPNIPLVNEKSVVV